MESTKIVTDINYYHGNTIHKRNIVCEKCNREINPGETMVQSYKTGRSIFGHYRRIINCCETCGLSKDDKRLVFKHCTFCGRPFYKIFGRSKKHIFCSGNCQSGYYSRIITERRREARVKACPVCDAVFSAQRSDTKFCSNTCKQKFYRNKAEA
jgi:uncharacterized C2H2 Zn-finger protein